MTDTERKGDIEVALANGAELAGRALTAVVTGHEVDSIHEDRPTGLYLSVLPAGDGQWAVGVEDVEQYLEEPREKRGGRLFTTVASFIEYLNRHKTAKSTVYASERAVLTAVIDDHGPEGVAGPGWGRHVAVLERPETLAWQTWRKQAGKAMTQEQFAEFLEVRMRDIGEPDGATLFELVRFFQASKSIAFKSSRRLDNGQVQFQYEEQVTGGASRNGATEVPTDFTAVLARFREDDPAPFSLRLRWRLNHDELTFMFLMDDDEVEERREEDLSAIMEKVRTETEVPVFQGSYQAPAGRAE